LKRSAADVGLPTIDRIPSSAWQFGDAVVADKQGVTDFDTIFALHFVSYMVLTSETEDD
jgi:hypothetical protein